MNEAGQCAIEAGGFCDPATGRWRYTTYDHAVMRYNNCITRVLEARRARRSWKQLAIAVVLLASAPALNQECVPNY
jgi:hypothetical protein